MKKKLLIITDVMTKGGVDTYVINLAQQARHEGWQVGLVVDLMTESAIPKSLLNTYQVYLGPLYHRRYSRNIIAAYCQYLFNNLKPTLVHVVCGIPWSCLDLREEAIRLAIPLIHTEQYIPEDISFTEEELERIRTLYNKTRGIIFVSRANQQSLMSKLDFPSLQNTFIIPNSIPVEKIKRMSLSYAQRYQRIQYKIKNSAKLKLLFMGRLTNQKGADLFIKSLSLLPKEIQTKIQAGIFGEGSDYLSLKSLVREHGLEELVRFYPWAESSLDLFKAYDLFVFPSRNEGLSFTLLEALASNIPVVASDIPPNIEATNRGQYAQIFESESIAQLAYLLQDWVNAPYAENDQATNLQCTKWLMTHFNQAQNMKATSKIWEQVIYGPPQ